MDVVRRYSRLSFFMLLLVISILLWREYFDYRQQQVKIIQEQREIVSHVQPIQVVHRLWLERDKIPVGGTLIVHYDITRIEECHVVIERFIVDDTTNTVFWSGIGPAGETGVGEHLMGASTLEIPSYIKPGHYVYRSVRHNAECERSGRTFTVPSYALPFEIVSP